MRMVIDPGIVRYFGMSMYDRMILNPRFAYGDGVVINPAITTLRQVELLLHETAIVSFADHLSVIANEGSERLYAINRDSIAGLPHIVIHVICSSDIANKPEFLLLN